ncbi:MAG: DUF928 domain-containing protein [Symploca sp. SIO2B6]|nr:DUF928 domain-containing protein [Symploca sp. SIO2B6]
MQYLQLGYKFTTASVVALLMLLSPATLQMAHAQGDDPDSNEGLPPGTVGGGSRGSEVRCGTHEPLMAFIPNDHVLKATEEQPTLWFYLPDLEDLTHAEFVLYDENYRTVVDTTFSIADQSGMFGVNLAAITQAQPLELNRNYRWFFSLICPDNRAADISVDGWFQPIALSSSLTQSLSETKAVDQVQFYLREGLWSEALSVLIDLHASTPATTLLDEWNTIIQTMSHAPVSLSFANTYQLNLTPDLH